MIPTETLDSLAYVERVGMSSTSRISLGWKEIV